MPVMVMRDLVFQKSKAVVILHGNLRLSASYPDKHLILCRMRISVSILSKGKPIILFKDSGKLHLHGEVPAGRIRRTKTAGI